MRNEENSGHFILDKRAIRGHSKSKLVVEGGEGSLNINRKLTGGWGSNQSVRLLCEKKMPELFLISCLAVAKGFAVFESTLATKVFFN